MSDTGEQVKDIPNGASANIGDVKDHNREVNATSTTKNPPVDGSNRDDAPIKVKPSIRNSTTFNWKDVGSWSSTGEVAEDKTKSLSIVKQIESYVIDHFYGDWYWNTAIMIGTCFFSWLVARMRFGFFSLLLVFLCTGSVYRLEFRRFNRDIRDDMTRISASNRLEEELETMEWLNSFLDKFWVIYMPALSEQIMFVANEVLKDQAPGMGIEKLSLDEFTLGSKAPRVNSIKSYTRKGRDHIEMDWAFSFAPNDTDDMTKNEIKKKINPKVALGITVGKAFISKSLPILVEDMAFTGRMNFKLKLSESFPHVKMVSVQFLEAPTIDYSLKPVGGDTFGFDIMTFIPGLSSFVNNLIHANLRPMLYAPNSLDIDVEEIMAGQSNDANGCVAVTVRRCIKLKTGADTKDNSINPYVQLKLSGNPSIDEKTKVKKAVNDPIFMDTKYLLVTSLDGNFLTFNVFDFVADQVNDKLIGSVEVPLADLLQKEVQTNVTKNIVESGKTVGKIEFDLRHFPTLDRQTLDDGSKEENTDSEVGIMKLTLVGANNLDLSESVIGLLNPYAEIFVNGELVKSCRRLRKTNAPEWNQNFESLITQQSEVQVEVLVKDSANENIVGRLDCNLQDIIFETSRGQKWIKTPPVKQGGVSPKIGIIASWKALGITDEKVANESNFGAPIGGLRLHIRGARDLKNLEAVGEVDPYVKVMVNGKLRAKTVTIAETCNPVYDSVFFFPIDNEHQHLLLSIMDAEPDEKDRALGSCAIHVNDFIKKNDEGYLLGYDGSNEVVEQPVLYNGQNKGSFTYSVSFIPNIPVLTQKQKKYKKLYQNHLKELEEKETTKRKKDEQLVRDYPDKFEFIEINEKDVPSPPRKDLPLDDIIKYRAGTLSVTILGGKFIKPDLYLHTLFDDLAFPSGVTPKAISRNLTVASGAEVFIRDLPNSNTVFRLSKAFEVNTEKDVVTEKTFSTIELLKKSYNKPIDLRIDEHNTARVQFDFVPTAVKLHPLDTVLDVGKLYLEIVKAEGVASVDSNGKSDPMAVLKLDGVQVYKTEKKRKTLDPVWNESTEFPLLSRSRQIVLLEVYDWDLTHDPELLGRANIDLSTMDVHTSTPFALKLDTQGVVHLRGIFKPEYIRPALGNSGGFPVSLTDVAGVPLKVVGGAAGMATGAVGGAAGLATGAVGSGFGAASDGLSKGGSFLKGFGKSKRKKKHTTDDSASLAGDSESIVTTPSKSRPSQSQYTNDLQSLRSGHQSQSGRQSQQSPQKSPSEAPQEIDEEEQAQLDEEKAKREEEKAKKEEEQANLEEQKKMEQKDKPPQIVSALPNVHAEDLPPPQKPGIPIHRSETQQSTPDSTVDSSFSSSIMGSAANAGRLSILSASGYPSNTLEVKVVLKTPSKDRNLFKTRACKFDKKTSLYKWNESIPFKSVPESELIIILREKHTFSSKTEVDSFTISLGDYIGRHEDIQLPGKEGTLIVNLAY